MAKPVAELTKPVQAVGMAAAISIMVNKTRGPTVSQSGPTKKRTKMVPPTPTMEEVQTSPLVSRKSSRISDSKGEMANQMKKAIKKALQE
eukprot:CAMPEP_0168863106 /NCGR_PEP_ID=MMETSP0727-20121128/18781_1 /TAXON_ID=265536 /ORGANISM="Amphiprora sp., Strain CCMP467" /LENGTH=89 /DNA_ID=CAMNT_0008918169 /DNA_START=223 /DNA_END=492 /DNA_ORIENTATION=-